MTVAEATEVTTELVEAFARLIPQLSSSSPPPGRAELAEMVDVDSLDRCWSPVTARAPSSAR